MRRLARYRASRRQQLKFLFCVDAFLRSAISTSRIYGSVTDDLHHDGEIIDFHSLRHTCGSWLAMTGTHPNVVQQVMRHSTITLTMDTDGHLFPGQEADAVDRLRYMLVDDRSTPESLRATGTTDRPNQNPKFALQLAQQSGRVALRSAATPCDQPTSPAAQKNSPKPVRVADLDDAVRVAARSREK